MQQDKVTTVGVISDTHGLLRPEAVSALQGSSVIIHAGDIGSPGILQKLEQIAPVTAIRGNIDTAAWSRALPETNVLEVAGLTIYVVHNLHDLDLDPCAARFDAVVFGHSHQPLIEHRNTVLFFNPGSAGPRRFKLPISVGRLSLRDGKMQPEIIRLD
ncbi:MAG TPA: metallophosphoesterase family protein [Terriglobales bacterium]|nr:metallophosphoesterase family protein [Terriglobales bacterium]